MKLTEQVLLDLGAKKLGGEYPFHLVLTSSRGIQLRRHGKTWEGYVHTQRVTASTVSDLIRFVYHFGVIDGERKIRDATKEFLLNTIGLEDIFKELMSDKENDA